VLLKKLINLNPASLKLAPNDLVL
jgi:hypothetical protein